ncbi:hypothetical protein ACGFI9_21205 [Micromonospora sp. NPDC048930]
MPNIDRLKARATVDVPGTVPTEETEEVAGRAALALAAAEFIVPPFVAAP